MSPTSLWAAIAAALIAGMVVPIQAGANGRLGRLLGHPLLAALVSLAVSLGLLVAFSVARAPRPDLDGVRGAPAWIWLGGVAGALYVATAAAVAPRLGAAAFSAAVVTGQLAAAALLDHAGALGFAPRPLSLLRVAGLALVAAGAVVVQRATVVVR